jgi:hypothetical protein
VADYTNSRPGVGAVYPENAVEVARQQYEPLLTVDLLKTRHLFGVPLVSAQKDPLTGKAQVMTDAMLSDFIEGAVAQAELELKIDIFPVQRQEKQPFDITLYNSLGYFQLSHRPAYSIDKLSVTPSNGLDVYVVPNEWVEGAYLQRGQINIVPLTVAFVQGTYVPMQSSGGAAFLQILGNKHWIPAWWMVTYGSGFKDGLVPRVINDYIGCVAAIEILSSLALTYARANSHSLGIDALSQSTSGPGPQIFKVRLEELEAKKAIISKKVRGIFGFKVLSGTL